MNKIFIVTHLPYKRKSLSPSSSIKVGNGIFPAEFSDDSGEQIAKKNPYFCELTALYLIWKKYKYRQSDYLGLMHYRRMLTSGNFFDVLVRKPVSDHQLKKDLEVFDLILPEPDFFDEGLYKQYTKTHPASDLDLCFEVLVNHHPELKKNIGGYKNIQSVSLFNIFISKGVVFDEYCSRLFPILFELEKNISLDGRSAYQKRAIGFLAERLLNIWVMSKPSLKIKYYPILRADKSGLSNLRRLFFA